METMQNAEGKEREGELERNGKERGKGKEGGPEMKGCASGGAERDRQGTGQEGLTERGRGAGVRD